MIQYKLFHQTSHQIFAFKRGFNFVIEQELIEYIPSVGEFQLLVEGINDIDVGQLRLITEYEGIDFRERPNKQFIDWFWKVVNEFNTSQKQGLLEFVTGSSRIPMGGYSKLKFVIQKTSSTIDDKVEDDHLPTASVCFNKLVLPSYTSMHQLRTKLIKALEHSKGFGLA